MTLFGTTFHFLVRDYIFWYKDILLICTYTVEHDTLRDQAIFYRPSQEARIYSQGIKQQEKETRRL